MVFRKYARGYQIELFNELRKASGLDRGNDNAGAGFSVRPCIMVAQGNAEVSADIWQLCRVDIPDRSSEADRTLKCV